MIYTGSYYVCTCVKLKGEHIFMFENRVRRRSLDLRKRKCLENDANCITNRFVICMVQQT